MEKPPQPIEKQEEFFERHMNSSGAVFRRENKGSKEQARFAYIAPPNPLEIMQQKGWTEQDLFSELKKNEIGEEKRYAHWLSLWNAYIEREPRRILENVSNPDYESKTRTVSLYSYDMNKSLGYLDNKDEELETAIRQANLFSQYGEQMVTDNHRTVLGDIRRGHVNWGDDSRQSLISELPHDRLPFKIKVTVPISFYDDKFRPRAGETPKDFFKRFDDSGKMTTASMKSFYPILQISLLQISYLRGINAYKEKGLELDPGYERNCFAYAAALDANQATSYDEPFNAFYHSHGGGVFTKITGKDPKDGLFTFEPMMSEEIDRHTIVNTL